MKAKQVSVLLAAVALVASVGIVARVGFRCEQRFSYQGFTATLCYRWFRPDLVKLTDKEGRVFYYGLLNKPHVTHDPPVEEYVDLFGSGRISEFVSNRMPGVNGVLATQQVSTRDDGRIDLVLEFEGRALTKALAVDLDRCSSWTSETSSISSRKVVKQLCTDPAAIRQIDVADASQRIANLQVRADREQFLSGRLKASIGRQPGPEFRM